MTDSLTRQWSGSRDRPSRREQACGNYFKVHLPEVVASGMVSEETIERAPHGIMLARFRLGL
jgi:hypothetical protein